MLKKNIFSPHVKKVATRKGYGEAVAELGEKNKDIVVLCGDLTDSTRSNLFAKKFPKRFFEVGVAEQNMAGIAAGLALGGKIPFVASYAVFLAGRSLGQIRLSICYSNANVKIAASHAGLSAAPDGATHQALEDISNMRVLPNMTVLSPADYNEAKKATVAAANHKGPIYIRLMRVKTPVFTTDETRFVIGKATILEKGRDVTIIATGPSVYDALLVARDLKKEKNISCEVINCSTIKPIDKKTILKSAKKTKKVVTVEEHQMHGGLGSAVCEILSQNVPTPVKIVGIQDSFGESGSYEKLKHKYKISTHYIKKAVFDII